MVIFEWLMAGRWVRFGAGFRHVFGCLPCVSGENQRVVGGEKYYIGLISLHDTKRHRVVGDHMELIRFTTRRAGAGAHQADVIQHVTTPRRSPCGRRRLLGAAAASPTTYRLSPSEQHLLPRPGRRWQRQRLHPRQAIRNNKQKSPVVARIADRNGCQCIIFKVI